MCSSLTFKVALTLMNCLIILARLLLLRSDTTSVMTHHISVFTSSPNFVRLGVPNLESSSKSWSMYSVGSKTVDKWDIALRTRWQWLLTNRSEDGKILDHELHSDLDGVQLQQVDRRLFHQLVFDILGNQLVRAEYVFDVIPETFSGCKWVSLNCPSECTYLEQRPILSARFVWSSGSRFCLTNPPSTVHSQRVKFVLHSEIPNSWKR